MKELEVHILIRSIPNETPAGDVALEAYKAVIEALRKKYAIMGYNWAGEEIYQ